MLQLYAMKITEQGTKYFEQLTSVFHQERREQLLRCRNVHAAMCSACGELMARVLIGKLVGQAPFELNYRKNQYGKPYVENCKYHFNISHSGEWVFCGISTEAIGVDVEHIKDINEKIANRCFTKSEQSQLMEKEEDVQHQYFYTLWTLKESYVKYMGEGLRIPLDAVGFTECNGQMQINVKGEQQQTEDKKVPPAVTTGIWNNTYAYSVIGGEILQEENITEINLQSFVNFVCEKQRF